MNLILFSEIFHNQQSWVKKHSKRWFNKNQTHNFGRIGAVHIPLYPNIDLSLGISNDNHGDYAIIADNLCYAYV